MFNDKKVNTMFIFLASLSHNGVYPKIQRVCVGYMTFLCDFMLWTRFVNDRSNRAKGNGVNLILFIPQLHIA